MRSYKPNEKIVDRAVELWKKMLLSPKYDNGDKSINGIFARGMASMLPNNTTPYILDKFGKHLKVALMTPDENGYYITTVGVDYGADKSLSEAAKKAGLEMEFPWKTDMSLYENYLNVRAGYGAETLYHYPLKDGRWLVTMLCGTDISEVIKYVEGEIPNFVIES